MALVAFTVYAIGKTFFCPRCSPLSATASRSGAIAMSIGGIGMMSAGVLGGSSWLRQRPLCRK
ncbi:MAG: hypothetical protein R3F11_28895 [Verrucomicrobiales bacterium]